MAQIKKRFIADNAIDGSKIQLQNDEAIRVKTSSGGEVELFKLDSSNLFQFISMPQLGSNPVNANDAARKAYVDAELLSEAGLRIAGDAAEQAAREAAIAAEQSARQAADAALQSALDQEVADRIAAVSAEQSAREAGDANLQAQIDALDSGSSAGLAQEVADRIAGDSNLQSQVDAEKARIDAILLASDADKDSFAEIVSLINSVDTENDSAFASYVLSNNAALAQEVSDRQAAVSAEEAARIAADSAEASARQAADSAEASARQAADSAEQAARIAADSAEASARQAADATLQSNLDAKQLDGLANVTITSKVAGQLIQWDAGAGKWVNVSPLTEATTGASSVGAPTVLKSVTATSWNQWGGRSIGLVHQAQSGDAVSKFSMKLAKGNESAPGATLVTAKIYAVTNNFVNGNGYSIAGQMTLVATSSTNFAYSTLPDMSDPSGYTAKEFTFSDVSLTAGQWYYVAVELDGFSSTGNYFSTVVDTSGSSMTSKVINGPTVYGASDLRVQATIYKPGAVTVGSPTTGVIKTNSSGLLDDSFLEYDVNFGGHKLQGVSAPSADTDAANKKYVDDEVSAEEAARISAVSAEASARQAADSAEAAARAAADSAEASARQAADSALDARLDVIEGSGEGSVAKALQDAKDYTDVETAARQAAVSAEQSARESADANLQSQINNILSNTDPAALDSLAEVVAAFQAADGDLNDAISALGTGSSSALGQEISDRQAADAALQAEIDAEESRALAAESALQSSLNQEVSDRQAAVSAEQSAREAADSAEQAARMAADSAETSARQAADTTLQNNIDAEEAAREAAILAEQEARAAELPRFAKSASTLSSTDVSNGYVDLGHVAMEASVNVFLDRLALHEGDDYTMSTVSGKTRVTFTSSFMASEEAAAVGDLFRCSYAYKNGDQP